MQNVITPSRAAEIDRHMIEQLGIPGILLMEQAACAVADEAQKLANGGKILVLCGKGNNGGDGWAAARILITRG
ncbi:MAG: bifunctional ADP-dependent NAD(P)H-hydrate dehydratase/NAD(P)H-hydrate epimerase, partial [Christensenellaceae bacterium]|nr:bifunctional ADP-dependent NAD(P)H-hydrate dehydratase/NAD(P)H-hydrate epimerase [Christensenellaceae bacterium]